MKRYTVPWALNPRQTKLTRAQKPKPFPGRYPTRIAYVGTLANGQKVSYIGKPTRQVISRYRDWLKNYQLRDMWIIEFDRNGVIARDKNTGALVRTCEAAVIRNAYHPFPGGSKFFPYLGHWRKVMKLNQPRYVFWPDNVALDAAHAEAFGVTFIPGQTDVPAMREPEPEPAADVAPMQIPEAPMPVPVGLREEIRRAQRELTDWMQTTPQQPAAANQQIRFTTYAPMDFWGGLPGGRNNNGQ